MRLLHRLARSLGTPLLCGYNPGWELYPIANTEIEVVGMLVLRKPSIDVIRCFLDSQQRLDINCAAVGATAANPPQGYVVDHTRVKLGSGEQVFSAGRAALEKWEQFRLGWMEAWSPQTPIQKDEVVAVLARAAGVWWLNACRIVYVIDERASISRFGFAYGTLPGHAESGEERFLLEWDQDEGSVWYDILAFSRPNHFLARVGYPFVRRLQKRFARESAAAMRRCSS